MNSPKLAGSLNKYGFAQADNVWSVYGVSPTIITGGYQIGHQINLLEESENPKSIKFMSTHGVVDAMPYDCVSLTFGMSKVVMPHTPVMRKTCKSLTTMCDHDIGVVIEDE